MSGAAKSEYGGYSRRCKDGSELPDNRGHAGELSMVHLAKRLGISRSRVWQLERRALKKIKLAIELEAAAAGVSVREWLFPDE
jgi:hypothetical protein